MTANFDDISEAAPKKKMRIWPFIAVGVLLLAILGVGGFFLVTQVLQPRLFAGDEVVARTITLSGVEVAVYPNAEEASLSESDTVEGRQAYQTSDDVETIAAWYQATFTGQGYKMAETLTEGTVQVFRYEKDDTNVDLQVWELEGANGFGLTVGSEKPEEAIAEATMPESVATTLEGESELVAEKASPTATPLPPVPPVDDVQLTVTADVSQITAGTLTRFNYDLTLAIGYTDTITATVRVTLPDGITLMVDYSPGIHYYPADREVTWKPTLIQGETQSIKLVAVTDLFIKPGAVILPVYLDTSMDDETRLVVEKIPVIESGKFTVKDRPKPAAEPVSLVEPETGSTAQAEGESQVASPDAPAAPTPVNSGEAVSATVTQTQTEIKQGE